MCGAHRGEVERGGKRRWFQFSLRLLMTVVTLCAVLLGLVLWRVREREQAVAAVRELGGSVILGSQAPVPEWLRRVVPSRVVVVDLADTEATNESLSRLESQSALRTLKLDNTKITPGGLVHLEGLAALESLSLAGTAIVDADLVHLARVRNLARLDLHGTQITDAGLEHLGGLASLEDLDVRDTRVTDTGLQPLGELTRLKRLSLDAGQITGRSVEHLQGLPGLEELVVRVPRGTGKQAWTLLRPLSQIESSGLLPPDGPAIWQGSCPWATSPAGVAEVMLATVELSPEEAARLLRVLAETRSADRWGKRVLREPQPERVLAPADRIDSVEQLLEAIGKWDDSRFYTAVRRLPPDMAREAIPALLRVLEEPDAEARRRGARLLSKLGRGDRRSAVALARMLKGQPRLARGAAAYALEEMAPDVDAETAAVVAPLLVDALDDEHWEVKGASAGALGDIGGKHPEQADAATAALLKVLEDESAHVRMYAAYAFDPLAQGNPERAETMVSALVTLLRADRSERRRLAIALGGVGRASPQAAKAALPVLLEMLPDRDSYVGTAAANALARIADSQPQERTRIVPELLGMLQDPDPSVRSAAERAFSALADAICESARESGDRSTAVP